MYALMAMIYKNVAQHMSLAKYFLFSVEMHMIFSCLSSFQTSQKIFH